MSTHEDHPNHVLGQSLEETRAKVLLGQALPPYEEMVTKADRRRSEKFLAAIADA
jgi:hypothetical protein